MKRTWRSALLAGLLAISGGAPRAAGEPPSSLEAKVQSLVARIVSGPEADRRAAAAALTALGSSAVVPLGPLLPLEGPPEAVDALVGALADMGPDRALGAFLANRSAWGWGHREGVEAVLDALRKRRPASISTVVVLKPAMLSDLDRVPPDLEGFVGDHLPEPLTRTPVAARKGKKVLEVDVKRDGSFSAKVIDGKPSVLSVTGPSGVLAVGIHRRLDEWIAVPASVLSGAFRKVAVEILDGDLDGKFTGQADRIRFGEGAFRPVESPGLFALGPEVLRYVLVEGGALPRLEIAPEPPPEGVPTSWTTSLSSLNEWRNLCGMAPQMIDVPHSRACELHAAYCKANGVLTHSEDPKKPGYTENGARAGAESSVWPNQDPAAAIRVLSATVLHRVSCMAAPVESLGVGGGPISVIWGGGQSGWAQGRVLLVPAPGQRGVPRAIAAEEPDPEHLPNWYDAPRGYPVSATIVADIRAMRDVRLTLVRAGLKPEQVAGTLFTPESPYHSQWPDNRDAAYFVASAPLAPGQPYVAHFTATGPAGPVALSWSFTTE